ncbi:MAG TPA: Ig-like domain-containing protein [Gemmatimonadales bacterium]
MKRLALLLPVALVMVGCQDIQHPTANYQVSDGSSFGGNGNPHFFFLPPLVPAPSYSGTFDPSLLPYLSIRVSGPFDTDADAVCGDAGLVFDASNGLTLENESYAFGWNTGSAGLESNKVYRVCVRLTPPGVGGTDLGFRDVSPTQGGGSVAEDPVYLFNNGSNLAIKFRVEVGVLNTVLCTSGELGDDYDCTAQILNSNETALCENQTCLLTTGVMAASELFLVEKFGVDNPRCFESDGTSTVDGFPLSIDIPQYAGCVRVTLFDEDLSFQGFLNSFGTVGACFYPGSNPYPLKPQQDEAIQLHIQYPGAEPTVWALPWGATGEIFAECELIEQQAGAGGLLGQAQLAARKLWRGAQRVLNPWFAPPPVWAFHTGFGGHSSFIEDESGFDSGTDGGTLSVRVDDGTPVVSASGAVGALMTDETVKVFHLAWALPSQMAAAAFCAGAGCEGVGESPLRVNVGDVVTVSVQVTDNGAVPDASAAGGRSLDDPRAVHGATVTFAASDGATQETISNADGLATFQWTATAEGPATITASGFGIGTTGGPFDAFANGAYTGLPTLLALGQLAFDVEVCAPAPNVVDGSVTDADEYPTTSDGWRSIPVNLGGNSSGTAYLYITNDCDNLYLTFLMPSDPTKDNKLRFVFAQNGQTEGPLDDILSLSAAGFRDRYLSQACIGSKQADCGPDDPDTRDGTGVADHQVFASPYLGSSTWFVYEMQHPLSTGSAYDLNLKVGDTVYFYGAVSLGGGSKGNTEFPDQKGNFKNYGYSYTVQGES